MRRSGKIFGQCLPGGSGLEPIKHSMRIRLFYEASMVYPENVNGRKGHYYDPWANDQDWALYYALKFQNCLTMSLKGV
ncbi:hypothetical protein HMPREF0240_03404 [Clostridium sp. D5]|nr:hypothetical protein HMPREF0240_03404 [Clostridium sp. D5]